MKAKVVISVFVFIFGVAICGYAQPINGDTLLPSEASRNNNVFIEAGGALWYAIGYERTLHSFKKHPFAIYTNMDFSYYPKTRLIYSNPGIGVTYGRQHQVDLEIRGLVEWQLGVPLKTWSNELEAKREGRNFILPAETASSIGIGYRVILLNNRLLIRAKPLYQFKYDLVLEKFTLSRFWFSVAVGYKFGK